MLQLVIKGLMQKNYESMAEIVIVLEQRRVRDKYHLNLLFYLALVLLYKLKKTSSNAQTINVRLQLSRNTSISLKRKARTISRS